MYSQPPDVEFEVIVVDNASYDGCDEMLKKGFPRVIFIQSKKNHGFAYANNLGFQHSTGKTLLFLNPDTEIISNAVKIMYTNLQTMPDAGAIGCRLLNTDLSLQTSCIQPYPTVLNQAFDIDYLKFLFPTLKLWGMKPLFRSNDKPQEVEVISGACIMVKRSVFEEVNQFSTDYFMYSEDLDLCYKINQTGYKTYYVNSSQIIHHGGKSTKSKQNYFGIVLMRESVSKFMEKYRGKKSAYFYKSVMTFVSICRMMLIIILMPSAIILRKQDTILVAFTKWKKIFRWSIGYEKWAKELTSNSQVSHGPSKSIN
ncbi:glycosyl transferase family 2 [Candidatus Scalindua japonica]|uniref:Glycosyl transferase family 2 n=2 Tax=Candidatus Scalindua japonica TaxID=1284222 RepID=A0A286TZA7_9BACT|nr:glycosyl transferase family 2 [Candidatus Scalindua japonica]